MLRIWLVTGLIFFITAASASDDKFLVDGENLFYDSEKTTSIEEEGINWADVDTFERILKANPAVKLLTLNSAGGDLEAAQYMADLTIDFELNTNVRGSCESGCTLIFLGGEIRTVERGSWLGFHQSYWDASYIEEYFNDNKDTNAWADPFEFASWLYEDTQKEILARLQYFVERKVDAAFAIKTMRATADDMWYPRRKELIKAGVINAER